jgi:hypothetical protein
MRTEAEETPTRHPAAPHSPAVAWACVGFPVMYIQNNILVSRPFIIRVSLKLLPSFISRLADQSPRFSKTLFG